MYRYLLVDNDNTLMDFHAAEHAAIRETLSEAGLPADDAACELYAQVNDSQWKALERGEITQDILRVRRFALFLEKIGRTGVDAVALCNLYEYRLGCHAELLPGAEDLLRDLHKHYRIALVSNGIAVIQNARLSHSPFMPYLDALFISGAEGISKPDPAVIDLSLQRLGCKDKSEAIFFGDSLTADIACANAAGIDSLLLTKKDDHGSATYAVRDLAEARKLLMEKALTFRMATPDDGPACAEIQRPYIEKTSINFLYKPLDAEAFSAKIAGLLPRYPFIVAETGAGIVGFAYASDLRPHDAFDWDVETSIYVREDCRGFGIGKLMYEKLIALLERQGFLNLYACITVPNEPSVALHKALGFTYLGEFPNSGFKLGEWHGVCWLCRMPESYPECPSKPLSVNEISTEGIF